MQRALVCQNQNYLRLLLCLRLCFFAIKIVFVIEIVFVLYIVFAPVIGSMLSPWRGETAASYCLPKSELSETVTLFDIVFFCN